MPANTKKTLKPGSAANLSKLIQYQKNSIVSQQIIQKKTGSVTLFAFDAKQALSEHTAPFDALVQVIDGTAGVVIAGETHTLRAGDMIVMPANKPHAVNAVKKFKMLLIMIRS